ncbi:putative CCR4-NOT transcription complex protein [Chloropicon primus]|nr:putative CCR4-NOT transcription complex protein [Chloropicon primus]
MQQNPTPPPGASGPSSGYPGTTTGGFRFGVQPPVGHGQQQQQQQREGSGGGLQALSRGSYMTTMPVGHAQDPFVEVPPPQQQQQQQQQMVFGGSEADPPHQQTVFAAASLSTSPTLGTTTTTTPFDASDFPSLDRAAGGASAPRSGPAPGAAAGGALGGLGPGVAATGGLGGMGLGGAGMGLGMTDAYSLQFGMLRHKHGGNQNGEFSIQNEEFPALGGGAAGQQANSSGSKASGGLGSQFLQPYGQLGMPPPPPPKEQQQQSLDELVPPPPTGDKPTEKFGLLGLLGVIRMSDADLTTLALGTDLTTLGLNLNSLGSLYKSFASPWSDAAGLIPQQQQGSGGGGGGFPSTGSSPGDQASSSDKEPNFKVPQCYLQQVPLLQPNSIKSFPLETLFYMFYSTGERGEEGSVVVPNSNGQGGGTNNFKALAAEELWSRGWWYHMEHKLWLARVPNTDPVVKTDRYERGSFLVFDSMAWDIVRKDNFVLQYNLAKTS